MQQCIARRDGTDSGSPKVLGHLRGGGRIKRPVSKERLRGSAGGASNEANSSLDPRLLTTRSGAARWSRNPHGHDPNTSTLALTCGACENELGFGAAHDACIEIASNRNGANLAEAGETFSKIQPRSSNCNRTRTLLPEFGQNSANIDKFDWRRPKVGPNSVTPAQIWPNLNQT